MKKILLATTALALSAGLANAQAVTISGEGRMGIVGMNTGGGWTWSQENRLQFNFNVAVESDHGLTFGAWSRARINTMSTGVFSESRVWVESNGLRLTFGNVDGAIRGAGTAFGYAGGCSVGYVGGNLCGDTAGLVTYPGVTQGQNSTGNLATTRTRIDYSMGDTRVAISHDRVGATEVGARTSFDAFTVAAGYTTSGTGIWTVSGHYNGGAWGVGALVAHDSTATNWQLSGSVALGGGDLYAYVGRVAAAPGNTRAYGLSYGYGLGGGAVLTAGYEAVGTDRSATIGVAFGF
ncbi:porin [Pararhodobacter oceanensis]|uniref:Porin domain-containing protein n=1 Tax=Pararhodobacter oceanensis TaxID=2172121 RepID=A0A2T8HR06_9RHOB|nr:porin [Pararhodobacter oceanensis]PVH27858.1 hypothetical protein DDE20_15205 [Pararhodobacter oceanensis]